MEVVRQIINSNDLSNIVLPPSFKNKKVEVTILPFNEINKKMTKRNSTGKGKHTIESLAGIANKYARHDLPIDEIIKKEKEAWAEAMVDKHGNG